MPQDFSEKENLMVLILIVGDSLNDCGSLVDNDTLKAILLVQISVQVLLHSLPSLAVHVHAFVVVLNFLLVDVCNQISELLEGVRYAVSALLVRS